MTSQNNRTVEDVFFQPLFNAIEQSKTRACGKFTDESHILSGTLRALEKTDSGRGWVQSAVSDYDISSVSVSRYFSATNSARRLRAVDQVADDLVAKAALSCCAGDDIFAEHEELDHFAIYSTDGHAICASSHESEIFGKKRAPSHIYSLNLRNRSLSHLALCQPQTGKKKEHELATLKRIDANALRMGEPKGTKVIHAYDPAIVDYKQWSRWKQTKGIYIITLEKANSALVSREQREWDRSDSRNNGVISDEVVGSYGGDVMRRVTYCDPVTGKTYRFLTTEMTLPPGLIAFIYKLRWDIEKVYDHIKNDLGESKAWTKSESGKIQQALFITIAYNLCVIFERLLKSQEGITNEKSLRRARQRLDKQMAKAKASGKAFNSLVSGCLRVTKRSLQFLRWLRSCLRQRSSWSDSIETLRPLMTKYIT